MPKKKKKIFNLKEEYRQTFAFIKKSKPFIVAIIILFSIFFLIGFFVPVPTYLMQIISDFINELAMKTGEMSVVELIQFIFVNNIQVSFLGMILGFFFGLVPLTFAVINGYMLGFISFVSVQKAGIGILWRLLPHGIFELPAVFISLGIGLRFGSLILRNKLKEFKSFFWNCIRTCLLVIIPLLIIAGIIEGILVSFAG